MTKYSNEDLANKIDWEGSIIDAYEYGIRSIDIEDERVAALWAELEDVYTQINPLLREIEDALDIS